MKKICGGAPSLYKSTSIYSFELNLTCFKQFVWELIFHVTLQVTLQI